MSTPIEFQQASTGHLSLRQWVRNRWGCVVVVATFLYNFVLNGLLFNYNLLFVALQEDFGSSATLTGWVGSLPLGISLMLAPFIKLASERFGYRMVAILGVVSTSAGVIVTSFLPSLLPMFGTFGVMAGVGAGLFTVCAFDLIVLYFPERNTMRAVAVASTGSTTGMLAFSQIIALLITKYGWRITLRVIGALLFVVGLPCVLTYVLPSQRHGNKEKKNSYCKMVLREETSSSDNAVYTLHEKSGAFGQLHDPSRDVHLMDTNVIEDLRQFTSISSRADISGEGLDEVVKNLLTDEETNTADTAALEIVAIDDGISGRGSRSELVAADVESALLVEKEDDCSESTMNCHVSSQNSVSPSKKIATAATYDPTDNQMYQDESVTNSGQTLQSDDADGGYVITGMSNIHDKTDKKLPILEAADTMVMNMMKSEGTQEDVRDPGMLWKMGRVLTFPELWMISLATILNGIGDCFYYVNVISYLMSIGFEEPTGVQFVSFTALSNLVCKVLLVLVGDYMPFPRIFLQVISNVISICALIAFMLVTSVIPVLCIAIAAGMTMAISNVVIFSLAPDFFGQVRALETSAVLYLSYGSGFLLGSLVGQSIDNTGSYTSALCAFIGIYTASGIMLLTAPLYQRIFAPERFVTFELHRRKKEARMKRRILVRVEGESGEKMDKKR